MARDSRRPGKSRTSADRGGKKRNVQDDVPAVFQEMLHEASGSANPPLTKRRRVGETRAPGTRGKTETSGSLPLKPPQKPDGNETSEADEGTSVLQHVLDYSDSSDESEFDWEEVELENEEEDLGDMPTTHSNEPLSITIGGDEPREVQARRRIRKPITSAEKKIRLDIHKTHILLLLFHCFARNQWCNDYKLQDILRNTCPISPKLITKLHPEDNAIQLQRSKFFKEAINQICEIWQAAFTVTLRGMRRPAWLPSALEISGFRLPENAESFLDIHEFRDKAKELEGSADFGAQLFCALLRALGVETRLVCSLQVLPFGASGPIASPVSTFGKTTVYAADDERVATAETAVNETTPARPRPIQRIGRSRIESSATVPPPMARTPKRIPSPRHPVFWAEVLDSAYQKWIPVDPLALNLVGRPLKFEPALNDPENSMSYVIAFEEGGIAKDVTRRYTKAYNAKTRKLRVESTDDGQKWFERAMKLFWRRTLLDRDQLEEGALVQRELSEGMPKNIQDFKGHPVYVLERHLRQNEIIHPKREVGKIGQLSRATDSSSTELIYRRKDVHTVRSADRWFRLGRDIKSGEVPLKRTAKRAASRRQREISNEMDDMELDQIPNEEVGLYAIFQTELYIPPPIVNGQVPKNAYGNIDVYVDSMVPPGGVHILSPQARQAARTLSIDYADAVTGFSFKGRQGTAVVNGVVVAAEYKEAMLATLRGMAYAQEQALEASRSAEALRLWRKFAIGLKIVDRVKSYMGDDEVSEDDAAVREEIEAEMEVYEQSHEAGAEAFGGGFLLNADDVKVVESTAAHFQGQSRNNPLPPPAPISKGIHDGGGFMEENGGFLPDFNEVGVVAPATMHLRGADDQNTFASQQPAAEETLEGVGLMAEDSQPTSNSKEVFHPERDQTMFTPEARTPRLAMTLKDISDEPEDLKQSQAEQEEQHTKHSPDVRAQSPAALEISDSADAQSLLSHDPEDEDADPDWLD